MSGLEKIDELLELFKGKTPIPLTGIEEKMGLPTSDIIKILSFLDEFNLVHLDIENKIVRPGEMGIKLLDLPVA